MNDGRGGGGGGGGGNKRNSIMNVYEREIFSASRNSSRGHEFSGGIVKRVRRMNLWRHNGRRTRNHFSATSLASACCRVVPNNLYFLRHMKITLLVSLTNFVPFFCQIVCVYLK